MKTAKSLLIIGAGTLQVPAIKKAKNMGLRVIAADMDPNAPGFEYADKILNISTLDSESLVSMAIQLKPDGVLTLASDMPMRTVASIGEACGLNTISLETAINATDKGKMRQRLKEFNVPIPQFHLINNFNEYRELIKRIEVPFIVKPVDNSGSRGIFLVESSGDEIVAFNHAIQNSRSGKVLVEEFMQGKEVSVETLTIKGKTRIIAITNKLTTGLPHFIEVGHSIPATLTLNEKHNVEKVTLAAIKALGINVGPTHTEIIITNEGPKIVEIGARLGGDNITTHLVPLATSVDMVQNVIEIALNKAPTIQQASERGAAIRFLEGKEGIVNDIAIDQDTLKTLPGLIEIKIDKKIGDRVNKIMSSTDRIGYVLAQASNSEEAIEICNEALKSIKLDISPVGKLINSIKE